MGMSPGDALVANYLARAGRAASCVLPSARCADVTGEISRLVAERVGPAPRLDSETTAAQLAELGVPEALVATLGGASAGRFPALVGDAEHDTVDLGRVPLLPGAPSPGQLDDDGSEQGLGDRGADNAEPLPPVRPSRPDEDRGPDPLAGWSRLGWEALALALFVAGALALGMVAWFAAALLVIRSRFWDVRDKVRVLLGVPVAAAVIAVVWAWIAATQLQESNNSGTRIATAQDSLAEIWAVFPEVFCSLAAIYLAYALVRDHHTG